MSARTIAIIAIGIFAVAVPTGAQARAEGPVAVNTANLPQPVRDRLEEAAKRGPQAVIRYVNRTRMMFHLRADEVLAK